MRGLTVNGERVHCPTCFLVRSKKVYLELKGKRHWPTEDQPIECPRCHRRWETVRFFLYKWCPDWVPKLEAEAQERNLITDGKQEEEYEEWKWGREKKATAAIEAGTWSPTQSMFHLK